MPESSRAVEASAARRTRRQLGFLMHDRAALPRRWAARNSKPRRPLAAFHSSAVRRRAPTERYRDEPRRLSRRVARLAEAEEAGAGPPPPAPGEGGAGRAAPRNASQG